MRLTPVGPAVVYLLCAACAGAAVALALVSVLALPADSPVAAHLTNIAEPLGGIAFLGVVGVAIRRARQART